MGQFLTPLTVSKLMASMFTARPDTLCIIDAGAGVGSLSAALVAEALTWENPPKQISVTAYEVEPVLVDYLLTTLDECGAFCRSMKVDFVGDVRKQDFIRAAVATLHGRDLFGIDRPVVNAAILNPPYRKIGTDSDARRLLSGVGIETSNLYTAFLWLVMKMLEPGGELVAITPRSFCNGPYFRPFRRAMLREISFGRVHVFESRTRAFAEDDVLQENVIFEARKAVARADVTVTTSTGPDDEDMTIREIAHAQLVDERDPDAFLHIVPDEIGHQIGERMRALTATLADLDLTVSTGRVVDFRAREFLRARSAADTVPLIYPSHFAGGYVACPNPNGRKPNALALLPGADGLLVPAGHYVLVKRFSAKEEPRRVVAAVFDPSRVPCERVGFENHLNYFHHKGRGIPPMLAKGIAAFLNSTLVDAYFRQFNGHTQVNATDLRSLMYPSAARLLALGEQIAEAFPDQDELDALIQRELFDMGKAAAPDPILAKRLTDGARAILGALDVPAEQQNERSALTLLALCGMKPGMAWKQASAQLIGITEVMDYIRDHFGKRYAPNTRETIRRFTMHQFVQMGLVLHNPDNPTRPVNSPDNCYQMEPAALALVRSFRAKAWKESLITYVASAKAIRRLHPAERAMTEIPVTLPDGSRIKLTSGGQNVLVKDIVEKFCPRWTPGAYLIYVGDAGNKTLRSDEQYLAGLGVTVDQHGKMPDVVVHHTAKNWLVLIEAVTSHGPVNKKRHNELAELFKSHKTAGLVYVTAFLTRKAMVQYLDEISRETEVWVADQPTHLIHFNGERFLGPYPT